jgi:hypothetical protein
VLGSHKITEAVLQMDLSAARVRRNAIGKTGETPFGHSLLTWLDNLPPYSSFLPDPKYQCDAAPTVPKMKRDVGPLAKRFVVVISIVDRTGSVLASVTINTGYSRTDDTEMKTKRRTGKGSNKSGQVKEVRPSDAALI